MNTMLNAEVARPELETQLILSEVRHNALYLYRYTGPTHYQGGSDLWNLHDAKKFAHRYNGVWYDIHGRELYGEELEFAKRVVDIALDIETFTKEFAIQGPAICRPLTTAHIEQLHSLLA